MRARWRCWLLQASVDLCALVGVVGCCRRRASRCLLQAGCSSEQVLVDNAVEDVGNLAWFESATSNVFPKQEFESVI